MPRTSRAGDLRARIAGLAGLAALAWSGDAASQMTLPSTTATTPAAPTLPSTPTVTRAAPTLPSTPAATPASPVVPAVTTVPAVATTAAMPVDEAIVSTTPTAPTSLDPTVRPIVGERISYRAPNYPLLLGGLATFGLAYGSSVVIAAAVNTSHDNWLYIPVVGPWIDLANRPSCGGPLEARCSTEGGRKALLAASGILQGAGALAAIVGAFAWQRHAEIVTVAKANPPRKATITNVSVVPTPMGRDGYGVTALGQF
jgi:hypothetical protein